MLLLALRSLAAAARYYHFYSGCGYKHSTPCKNTHMFPLFRLLRSHRSTFVRPCRMPCARTRQLKGKRKFKIILIDLNFVVQYLLSSVSVACSMPDERHTENRLTAVLVDCVLALQFNRRVLSQFCFECQPAVCATCPSATVWLRCQFEVENEN